MQSMNTIESTSKKDYEMKENTKNIYIFHRKNIDLCISSIKQKCVVLNYQITKSYINN